MSRTKPYFAMTKTNCNRICNTNIIASLFHLVVIDGFIDPSALETMRCWQMWRHRFVLTSYSGCRGILGNGCWRHSSGLPRATMMSDVSCYRNHIFHNAPNLNPKDCLTSIFARHSMAIPWCWSIRIMEFSLITFNLEGWISNNPYKNVASNYLPMF